MKSINVRKFMVLSLVCAFLLPATVGAQPKQPEMRAPGPHLSELPKGLVYSLSITKIQPEEVVLEHSPIDVSFEFSTTVFGFSGPEPLQESSVCAPGAIDCVQFRNVRGGKTYRGTVHTAAPAAGKAATIRLELLAGPPTVGEVFFPKTLYTAAEQTRPIAARYIIRIINFQIDRTRARLKDTVKITLKGQVQGQRSAEADACNITGPPTYCMFNVEQGDHGIGRGHPVNNVEVGPFDLIPEVSSDLAFDYIIVNWGKSYAEEVARSIFNGASDAANGFINILYGNQSGDAANKFTHDLNNLQWGGCDGPVAVGGAVLLNKAIAGQDQATLDVRTRSTGHYSETNGPYEVESQTGCGRSGIYSVTWDIVRTSWR